MHDIKTSIEITTTPNLVLQALTTPDGITGWWTNDHDVTAREMAFRFQRQAGEMEVRFRVDKQDASELAMTCIAETNNADWLGTRLSFRLVPAGAATRVELLHAGYAAKNEAYEMCTKGWTYFMHSLKSYLETGTGTPAVRPLRDIVDGVEIAAPAAKVLAALTTAEGIRGWWTRDTDVSATEHTYRFGKGERARASTFRVEKQDARGIALVCIAETDPAWLATRLSFGLESVGSATRVQLVHAGFTPGNRCYDDCVGGWRHFMASLKAYVETGTGTPHVPA
jgi:uncharacterized protein YndB with AHSA1/START domain